MLSFVRLSATGTRMCNSFLLYWWGPFEGKKKVFQPIPTSYPVSVFLYKGSNSPEPISGDCLKRAELKTKQNNNDTPHFLLDNHNLNVGHYVPTHVPSTMFPEWEITFYDAHVLYSCIQTDHDEVIQRCGVALRTHRIEVWALLTYSLNITCWYLAAENEMSPQTRCRYV
jgi:hypothetical protein